MLRLPASVRPRFVTFTGPYRAGLALRSQARGARLPGSWAWSPGCPPGSCRGEDRASQVPGRPRCAHAPLLDPGGISASGLAHDASMQSSAVVTASTSTVLNSRGSLTQPACSLCTLRSAGYPASTQHSVPAGGQPLPGGIGDPPGRSRGFPSVLSAHPFPPPQASPGATQLLPILRCTGGRVPVRRLAGC